MPLPATSQFLGTLNQAATAVLKVWQSLDTFLQQNTASGGSFINNITQDQINTWNPNTSLTPAKVQAFVNAMQLLHTIRTCTDSTTLATAVASLQTQAAALYGQTPPLALDVMTLAMAQG